MSALLNPALQELCDAATLARSKSAKAWGGDMNGDPTADTRPPHRRQALLRAMQMLRWRLTLRSATVVLGVGLVLVAVGYWGARSIAATASEQVVRQCAGALNKDLVDLTGRSNRALSRMKNDLVRYMIPMDDPHAILRELYAVLTDEPEVDRLFFANEAGGNVSADRLADGTKVFLMTDGFRDGVLRQFDASPDGRPGQLRKSNGPFDARVESWYEKTKQQGRFWTQSDLPGNQSVLGITLAALVPGSDRRVAGVIGLRLPFTSLPERLSSRCLGYTGRMFIIGSGGQLIAASGGVSPVTTGGGRDQRRLAAVDADDPVVRETGGYLLAHPAPLAPFAGPGMQSFTFDGPTVGLTYVAATMFQLPGEITWTAIAAIPASDFLGPARHALVISLVISVAVVALTLLLGYWLVARTLRPLGVLTEAAQSIGRGEWRDLPEVQRNDEVGLLTRAFKRMTASLRDTQESLRQSEADYRSFFDNAIEGIFRTTPAGRVLSANPAAVRMLGYASAQEMITEITNTAEQLWVDPNARETLMDTLFRGKGAVSGYQAELKRKDGARITVLVNTRLVRDGEGQPLCAEGFITDITERKRAEEALLDARAQLAHVARVTTLGEMSASIAHEITQPLAAAAMNASAGLHFLANSTPDVQEARESLEDIVKNTQRATDVVQRIRALAKRAPPERDWLNVNDIIKEVATLIGSEVYRHQVALILQLDEHIPLVKGDRVQLQQVMNNLVMNAIEAIAAAGEGPRELAIGSGLDKADDVLVTVRDTGTGLAPKQLDRLFDAFYTTKPTGMGMGLRISHTIIESHGGRLWATTNTPRGAVFSFTLPTGGQARRAGESVTNSTEQAEAGGSATNDNRGERLP